MTSSTDKHTPGEWHVGTGCGARIVYSADGYVVADAVTYHGLHGDAAANARLIAAAPALLALARQYASECATCSGTGLVTIHDTYMGDADDQPCHDCADIRSAIARATNSEAT